MHRFLKIKKNVSNSTLTKLSSNPNKSQNTQQICSLDILIFFYSNPKQKYQILLIFFKVLNTNLCLGVALDVCMSFNLVFAPIRGL